MSNTMDFVEQLTQYQHRVHDVLDNLLPPEDKPPIPLHQAMRYSVLQGGKRLRAILVYSMGALLHAQSPLLDIAAASVELIHAYSLIHDDLPSMDNSPLRRGKPSCHIVFGEAIAILTGDTLQSIAFEHLAKSQSIISSQSQLQMITTLANAIGCSGMAAGQVYDIELKNTDTPLDDCTAEILQEIYHLKTGALISASIALGLLASGESLDEHLHLIEYGKTIGLAFQLQDDLLDTESSTTSMGKPQGLDIINYQPTVPSLIGIEATKKQIQHLYKKALGHLEAANAQIPWLLQLTDYLNTSDRVKNHAKNLTMLEQL